MSTVDVLLDLFRGDAGTEDPQAYLEENGVSPEEFLESMPEVCESLPPEQAEVLRAAYGLESPEGSPDLDPALADQSPPVPDDASTAELMEHYATVINISHSIEEAGDTIYIDQSVNQNIEAYGDVNQNFDQEAVAGEGAVLAGDGSQVNTGDGNAVISDSEVGSAAFGGGDASNVEAENANLGDGNIVSDTYGNADLNAGDGDMTSVDGSTLSESSLGEGDVYSDDATVAAEEGSSIGFGEGSTSDASSQTTDIEDNWGNANVTDDGNQTSSIDESVNDSYNTDGSFMTSLNVFDNSTNDSMNTDESYNEDTFAEDNSYDSTVEDNSDNDYSYTDNSQHDDDGTDADVNGLDVFGS